MRHVGAWAAVLLVACGGGAGPQPGDAASDGAVPPDDHPEVSPCTGDPPVPAAYPQLGPGCATHIRYASSASTLFVTDEEALATLDAPTTDDRWSSRGARPIPLVPGAYDLGLYTEPPDDRFYFPAALVLANLEPGLHRDIERFAVRARLGSFFDENGSDSSGEFSASDYGIALIEIAGVDARAVWGRYLARICSFGSECTYTHGDFAAEIETTPSTLEFGPLPLPPEMVEGGRLCFADAPDCPATTECATFPCERHFCRFLVPDPLSCGMDAICEVEGCRAF